MEISVQPRYLAFFVLAAAVCHYVAILLWRSRLSDYMNWIYNQTVKLRLELLWEANIKEKKLIFD
jgi:hypothetical protein